MKQTLFITFLLGIIAVFSSALAAPDVVFAGTQSTSMGTVAANLTTPISAVRYAFNAACYVLGAGFCVSTLFRYSRFRQNPQEAPFSSVITLLLIGVVLIILPLGYDLSHYWAANQGIGDVLPQQN
tara:strand:- start:509 stop:886 length:378 start_codon:yes stop_codon:yes gene_type:complete